MIPSRRRRNSLALSDGLFWNSSRSYKFRSDIRPGIKESDTSIYPCSSAFLSDKEMFGSLMIGRRLTSRSVKHNRYCYQSKATRSTAPSIFVFICVAVVWDVNNRVVYVCGKIERIATIRSRTADYILHDMISTPARVG